MGICIFYNPEWFCRQNIVLDTNSSDFITAQGTVGMNPPSHLAITGGVGEYRGVYGEVLVTPTPNGRNEFEIHVCYQ